MIWVSLRRFMKGYWRVCCWTDNQTYGKTVMEMFHFRKSLLACMITALSFTVIACNDAQIVNYDINAKNTKSGSIISLNDSTQSNTISPSVNPISHTEWSKLNSDEQVNEIKRITEGYGGELQVLAYADEETVAVADVYVLNADMPVAKRQQLAQILSELIGTLLVVNILDSRVTDEMGSLETLELSAINQDQVLPFSIDNDEQVDEVASIVKRYGAKLQSLGYSGDSELSLQVSYYPKKLTESDFENLERELKQLTGLNVAIDRRSIMIKPL